MSHILKLTYLATLLAFCVVVLGAYTRLTDAGLGCPDWPGCYGHMLVSKSNPETSSTILATKAWTEMTHRYLAGLLGILIFMITFQSFRNRHCLQQPLLLPVILSILVIFQALLGMWTVTLKLFPMVVMAHLLGGLTTLSLLWYLCLKLKTIVSKTKDKGPAQGPAPTINDAKPLLRPALTLSYKVFSALKLSSPKDKMLKLARLWALLSLGILIIQLFLGGWTSANYAALVCTDFPFCHGQAFFAGDVWKAFNLYSAGVPGSPGEPLPYLARVTIHMMHRIGALVTAVILAWLAAYLFTQKTFAHLKNLSLGVFLLLCLQIILGISNVLAFLPLSIAVLHNAVAALLLLTVITLNYALYDIKT